MISISVAMIMKQGTLLLRDNMRIAYQEWGVPTATNKILALHGWLDNSNSFKILGPYLQSMNYHCIAFDSIGHGKSSHLNPDAIYQPVKALSYLHEIIELLEWKTPIDLLGHSMGAGLSLMYAGTFPENIKKLILLEGLGPITQPDKNAPKSLRKAIETDKKTYLKTISLGNKTKLYSNFMEAVDARINTVNTYPGKQWLSKEAAIMLVER